MDDFVLYHKGRRGGRGAGKRGEKGGRGVLKMSVVSCCMVDLSMVGKPVNMLQWSAYCTPLQRLLTFERVPRENCI